MRLVLFTGMRRGELFKLQWDHVDFDRGFINIINPKGGPSQKIPLNASARELLESHPRSESEYVFPGRDGGRRVDIKKQSQPNQGAGRTPQRLPGASWLAACVRFHAGIFGRSGYVHPASS